MKKPRRRVIQNEALRQELIGKGLIIPYADVPKWLEGKGYLEAAKAAADRRR